MRGHQPTGTLWVCGDCLMWFANGEPPADLSEDEERARLASIDWHLRDVEAVTVGSLVGSDGCDCPEGSTDYEAHQGCEDGGFRWRGCATCLVPGHSLGGNRYAVTGWVKV